MKFNDVLDRSKEGPDHTAVRVALWRALHVQIDPEPHVFTDEIGVKLVGEKDWRNRPDMEPEFSKAMRASIVGRARFVEDLVDEEVKNGTSQYVILGAGLDSFAQRRADLTARLQVFEVDQPGPQKWKVARLTDTGFNIPKWLHFVPVDFEAGQSLWRQLDLAGFDSKKPAVVVSTGVSMYLSKEANFASLQEISKLPKGSAFVVTFMLSLDLLDPKERLIMEFVMKRAGESGTPFQSLFAPEEILDFAKKAGFESSTYVSAEEIYKLYFKNRTDGLRAGHAEAFLLART